MADMTTNAPWRGWTFIAKLFRKPAIRDQRTTALPKDLSDHLARDIGLDETDRELLRHRWPSQHNRHPML